MSSLDQLSWNEAKESSLITDPRFEAGLMSRQEGEYEASIDFFAELLKTYESEDTPLYLATLYFNYGSSLVCNIESKDNVEEDDEEEEEEEATSGSSSSSTVEGSSMSKKRHLEAEPSGAESKETKQLKTDSSITSEQSSMAAAAAEAGVGLLGAWEDEVEDEEEDDGDEDGDVAWQCLDMARDLYQKALISSDISTELEKRLKHELARTVSRIGDLNMLQGKCADALIEYELCIKLRAENKDTSVDNVCRMADANMQVAFAYLEHIDTNGEVDVEAASSDGNIILVAKGGECMQQCIAYRDQAKVMVENLINRLARDKVNCSKEEKDLICVQYQLLSDFAERLTEVSSKYSSSSSSSSS